VGPSWAEYHSLGQSEPEPTNNAPWRMNGKWTANRFLLGSSSCFFCYLSTNQLPNRWVVKTVLPYVESIYLGAGSLWLTGWIVYKAKFEPCSLEAHKFLLH
jgi:hypothetical protein